jgi:hypothetical protein
MKNKIILILFILFIPVISFAQNFKTLGNGIEYAEATREIDKVPVRMNLLRLDLTKVRIDVMHAGDKAIGVETTSSIATRHKAFAAINAGFFRLDNSAFAGDSVGIFQVDRTILSESQNDRVALGLVNGRDRTDVVIGHIRTSSVLGFGVDSTLSVSGINRERKKGEVIIYSPEFGASTMSGDGGAEIVIRCGGKEINFCRGTITAINEGKGNSPIPPDGMVISIDSGISEFEHYIGSIKLHLTNDPKSSIRVVSRIIGISSPDETMPAGFDPGEDIVAGAPQLIKNGRVDITWELEKSSRSFVETKHPRTAVARLKDGKFLMITVDGRSESSGGISLNDLAALLLELGATDAMNLDGGGSTTMFLNGKVVNHPSDKEGERKVSDALLVFPRKK